MHIECSGILRINFLKNFFVFRINRVHMSRLLYVDWSNSCLVYRSYDNKNIATCSGWFTTYPISHTKQNFGSINIKINKTIYATYRDVVKFSANIFKYYIFYTCELVRRKKYLLIVNQHIFLRVHRFVILIWPYHDYHTRWLWMLLLPKLTKYQSNLPL